jgi:hypothetical protein
MAVAISRILATGVAAFIGIWIVTDFALFGIWQLFMVCVGWALAYFGDEFAPLLGVAPSTATTAYVEPIVRAIGWLLLLVALGLFVTRTWNVW